MKTLDNSNQTQLNHIYSILVPGAFNNEKQSPDLFISKKKLSDVKT